MTKELFLFRQILRLEIRINGWPEHILNCHRLLQYHFKHELTIELRRWSSAVHNVYNVCRFHSQNDRLHLSPRKCIKKEFDFNLILYVCFRHNFPIFFSIPNEWIESIEWIDRKWLPSVCFFLHFLNHIRNVSSKNRKQNTKSDFLNECRIKHLNPHSNGMEINGGKNIMYISWKSSIKYWISNFINQIILLPDWRWFSAIIIRSTLDTKRFNYCGISQFRKSKDLNETKWKK